MVGGHIIGLESDVFLFSSHRDGTQRGKPDSRTEDVGDKVCFVVSWRQALYPLGMETRASLVFACPQEDAQSAGVLQLQLQLHGDPRRTHQLLQRLHCLYRRGSLSP